MKFEACFLLLLNMVCGMRRGPHHPHGQQPVDQKHHHYKPRGTDSMTADTNLLHDKKHIEEDTHVFSHEDLTKMNSEELEFHYFSAHDFDRNSKLDGLELLKAVYHTLEHESPGPDDESKADIEPESNNLDAFIALVDKTLETDDKDNDGYVSYAEYRAARQRTLAKRTPRVVVSNSP